MEIDYRNRFDLYFSKHDRNVSQTIIKEKENLNNVFYHTIE